MLEVLGGMETRAPAAGKFAERNHELEMKGQILFDVLAVMARNINLYIVHN